MMTIEPPSTAPIPVPSKSGPMRVLYCGCFALLVLGTRNVGARAAQSVKDAPSSAWKLSWSDEFNGPNGSAPDPARWAFVSGGEGFGNDELESYTARPVNAQVRDGNLVITARKEDFTGADGIPRHYTSARIHTKGLFAQAYGRFEASIQLPEGGKGIWPAFWLLGDNAGAVGWPRCGEVDIIENIGDSTTIYSTIHGPGYSRDKGISAKYPLPAGESVHNGFHLYAVEWAPRDIKFFFDGNLIAERTPADLPAGAVWIYDHPFFIILNLAVGGGWPGSPDEATTFPQQMLVNYVRVYTSRSQPSTATAVSESKRSQ
jgi:beta-glucanase (GH16 family)